MLHRATPEQVRHSGSPLRVSQATVDGVVDTGPLRCIHYDAFRFYTAPARPLNVVTPSRDTTVELEQPPAWAPPWTSTSGATTPNPHCRPS